MRKINVLEEGCLFIGACWYIPIYEKLYLINQHFSQKKIINTDSQNAIIVVMCGDDIFDDDDFSCQNQEFRQDFCCKAGIIVFFSS